MLPIHWRPSALKDLAEIARYIAERDPSAARRLQRRIQEALLSASAHPFLFRAGRVDGTREITAHPNYIIAYKVTDASLEVIAIVHARQEYP